jgi:hypothetical protein
MMRGLSFYLFLAALPLVLGTGCFEQPAKPAPPSGPGTGKPVKALNEEVEEGTPINQLQQEQQLEKLREQAKGMEHLLTVENLMRTWNELAAVKREDADMMSLRVVTGKLAEKGLEGLRPLVEVIGDPERRPAAKVFAVIALSDHATAELVPDLMPLTEAGTDTTTRVCALQTLSAIDAPEAQARVKALLEDEERRVRVTAAICLLQQEDPAIHETIAAIWNDPETTGNEKTSIFMAFPGDWLEAHPEYCLDILEDSSLPQPARTHAVTILGRSSEPELVPVLEKIAISDDDLMIRSLAQTGAQAVKERTAAETEGS